MDMKKKNWYDEFPEVPEHVHQTVLSTLAGLDDRKVKPGNPPALQQPSHLHSNLRKEPAPFWNG